MNATIAGAIVAFLGLVAPSPVAAEEAAPMPQNVNPLSAIDPASLTGFRDRPLFSPTRSRPPPPVPEAEAEAESAPAETQMETLNIHILGIVGTPEGLTALLIDLQDESRHSLRLGETFQGWTVSALNGTEMVVSRNDDVQRFPIFKAVESGDYRTDTPDDGAP